MRIIATADRVMETSDFIGQVDAYPGNIVLQGAVSGYRTFDDAGLFMGKIFPLVIEGIDGACLGQVWWGWGELDATGLALRYATSSGLSSLVFLAGTKRIFCAASSGLLAVETPAARALVNCGLTHRIKASETTNSATPKVLKGKSAIHVVDVTLPQDETFRVPTGSGITLFSFLVVASSASEYGAAWDCKALVNCAGGTPVIVGTAAITAIAADAGMAGTGVSLAFGTNADSSNALQVIVTGLAADTLSWTLVGDRVDPDESDPVASEYGYPGNFADY